MLTAGLGVQVDALDVPVDDSGRRGSGRSVKRVRYTRQTRVLPDGRCLMRVIPSLPRFMVLFLGWLRVR